MVKNEKPKFERSNKYEMSPLDFKEKSVRSIKNKRKLQKLRTFTLAEQEKKLLESSEADLKTQISESIEKKLEEISEKLTGINKQIESAVTQEEKAKFKKMKKHLLVKLAKNRKALSDEKEIKYRLSMLKQKKRKLKKIDCSVKENLEKLKKLNTRCFKCRRKGHAVAECTFDDIVNNEDNDKLEEKNAAYKEVKPAIETNKKSICYNCGSTEHNVHGCNKPVDYKDLPFSQCFICKEMGHLSSKCPKSDKGIYIKGGACFNCGGKDHLAKNCPTKQLELQVQMVADEKAKKLKRDFNNKNINEASNNDHKPNSDLVNKNKNTENKNQDVKKTKLKVVNKAEDNNIKEDKNQILRKKTKREL